MFTAFELILFMTFFALGAVLMRWADLRVERAVRQERARNNHNTATYTNAMPAPRSIPAPPANGLAPLPLQLDAEDGEALRRDGAVVKRRVRA